MNYLDNNEFGREGAKYIANLLIEDKTLKTLYISIKLI